MAPKPWKNQRAFPEILIRPFFAFEYQNGATAQIPLFWPFLTIEGESSLRWDHG